MNKRAKFELRKPLVLWSLSLAVFSIFGAVRTGAYMLYILMTKGLKQSVCDQSFYIGPVSKFWAYAFVLSKAPELGDTIFIILRKQKLIFLHWYHHITVLLYSWYSYKDMVAGGGWFMTMNYGVHAVMYSYYALRAAGFRVSRKFAMFITLSQITQMLIGCVINYLVFSWMQHGQCHSHVQNIIWSSLIHENACLSWERWQDCATLGITVLLHLPPGQCKDVQSALLWSCGDTTTKHTWNRFFLRFV
uniref:Elongation of very long chain fatty acids protein n=1 Tax=Serinus canaria TaxID=9135 RepID=A0A8C9NF10_SERCA